MALAPKIIVSIRDNKGKVSTTEIKIPTGITLSNMIEFAQGIVQLIDAITTGVIVGVSIGISVDTSGLGLTAAAGSTADVEEKGRFQFQTTGGFFTTVNIPCFSDVDVLPGSDAIDQAEVNVAAFIAAMTGGLTLVDTSVVQPSDSREDDITTLVSALERFRAS